MPLTDLQIRNAKPGQPPLRKRWRGQESDIAERNGTSATGGKTIQKDSRAYRLWDGGGLYLEVAVSGGKWWRWKYRFAEKEKRLSLGVYPEVSLAEARKAREECHKLLAQGTDPAEHRKSAKSARKEPVGNSFEAIARQWLKKFIDPMAAGHRKRVYARFENDVFPSIGARPIADITPKELLEVILRIEKRDAKDTAHRTLGSCARVFRFAVSTNRCPTDITRDLRGALAPAEAGHFAAVTRPEDLAGILRGIDEYSGTMAVQCALRLAPLVFVRPGELRQARWETISLGDAEWLLKLSKRKDGRRGVPGVDDWLIVPLSRQAVSILTEMHSLSGDGEFVFASDRYSKRCISDNAVNMALRRMGIPKEEMCGHGFRATARTILAQELQIRADLIEHQLGHQVIDPNGRAYNRTTFLPERRLMMQAWADYLDKLKSGGAIQSSVKKRLTDIRAIQVTSFA